MDNKLPERSNLEKIVNLNEKTLGYFSICFLSFKKTNYMKTNYMKTNSNINNILQYLKHNYHILLRYQRHTHIHV